MRLIFALRGGPKKPCPRCGSRAKWTADGAQRVFRSKCCGMETDVLGGTHFAEVNLELRLALYLLAMFFNRATPLSSDFVARHLGISADKAWRALAQIRRRVEELNAQQFDPRDYRKCYVDEFLYRPIAIRGRSARAGVWLLGLSGKERVHIEPLPSRNPGIYHRIVHASGLGGAKLYSCNLGLVGRMRNENLLPATACELTMASRGSQLVKARGRLDAFWPIFKRSMRAGSIVPRRDHVSRYVSDYVYRYNHRGDAGAMLRGLLQSIDPL